MQEVDVLGTTGRLQSAVRSSTAILILMWSLVVNGVAGLAVMGQDVVSAVERQSLIVVVGAAGTEEYGQQFRLWADRWKQAAATADADLVAIGTGQPDDAEHDNGTSDFQQLQHAVSELGNLSTKEPLWLVLIGHGTFDTRSAQFSLRGPDLSEKQLAEWCQTIKRPLAIINCSSCSAPFLNALSGPDRVVISATKDGSQIQYSRFGDAMSLSVVGLDADINRDGQTSLLEAWLFASRRTAEFYESEGRLATEHSLLDDNGDARGVRSELFEGFRPRQDVSNADAVDGKLASRWHLVRSAEERRLTSAERQLRDKLEAAVEQLRVAGPKMNEEEYLRKLQDVLVPLAELYEEVDARSGNAD